MTDRWWLVVLDDVQRPGDLTGLWPPAAESAAAGQVLVTTRLREAALAGAGRRTVEVPVFTPQEARAYLEAKLGDKAPEEQADALAEALGMLPLALAQAAAYIDNDDITIGRYLDLLAERLLRDVVPEPGHLTDDHQRIITATWELSIDQAEPGQARRARPARAAAGQRPGPGRNPPASRCPARPRSPTWPPRSPLPPGPGHRGGGRGDGG